MHAADSTRDGEHDARQASCPACRMQHATTSTLRYASQAARQQDGRRHADSKQAKRTTEQHENDTPACCKHATRSRQANDKRAARLPQGTHGEQNASKKNRGTCFTPFTGESTHPCSTSTTTTRTKGTQISTARHASCQEQKRATAKAAETPTNPCR